MYKMKHISSSRLDSFFRCGEAWRRKYIEKEYEAPNIQMLRGRALHSMIELGLKNKRDSVVLDLEHLYEFVLNEMKELLGAHKIEKTPENEAEVEDEISGILDITRIFHSSVLPNANPWKVEYKITEEVGLPWPITLRIDSLEKEENSLFLYDYKTSGSYANPGKSPSQGEIEDDTQQTFYALGCAAHFKKIPKKQIKIHLIKQKQQVKVIKQETVRRKEDFDAIRYKSDVLLKSLEREIFLPAAPTAWWCSPGSCPYFDTCKFVRKRRPKD